MIINNVEELIAHMKSIGIHFRDYPKADGIVKFDRIVNGKPAAQYVDTWIYWNNNNPEYIELGADYDGNPETWFSEQYLFPFNSSAFDEYLFDIETYRM